MCICIWGACGAGGAWSLKGLGTLENLGGLGSLGSTGPKQPETQNPRPNWAHPEPWAKYVQKPKRMIFKSYRGEGPRSLVDAQNPVKNTIRRSFESYRGYIPEGVRKPGGKFETKTRFPAQNRKVLADPCRRSGVDA